MFLKQIFAREAKAKADSVSPRMNTIASRDQFKPIRIGENLVVNYTPNCKYGGPLGRRPGRVS